MFLNMYGCYILPNALQAHMEMKNGHRHRPFSFFWKHPTQGQACVRLPFLGRSDQCLLLNVNGRESVRNTTYYQGQNPFITGFSHVSCNFSTPTVTDVIVNPDIKQHGKLTIYLIQVQFYILCALLQVICEKSHCRLLQTGGRPKVL